MPILFTLRTPWNIIRFVNLLRYRGLVHCTFVRVILCDLLLQNNSYVRCNSLCYRELYVPINTQIMYLNLKKYLIQKNITKYSTV